MRSMRIVLIIIFFIAAFSANSHALSILSQDPHFDMYENFTRDPMKIVFDESLNTSTANDATVYVSYEDNPGLKVAVNFSFETTTIASDTLVLTPTQNNNRWPFAERLELNITGGLLASGGNAFDGVFPFGQLFVANIPDDLDRMENWDPSDPFDFVDAFVNANVLLGFNPVDPENTNPNKPETIPGMGATEAWKWSAGRPDVIIAVVDDGIEDYDSDELDENFFLNKIELPVPTIGGTPCTPDPWDCNQDGKFNVRDYDDDPSFDGLGREVNVKDLIDTFSDGFDADSNGFIDDICGWDFLRRTNEALGVKDFPEGGHGEDRAKDATAGAENGYGDKPGFCPRCTVLPIRVSDSVMSEMNALGAGIQYAYDMGASVAIFASSSFDYSDEVNRLVTKLSEAGMVMVGVASDELGYHHSFAGSCDDVISVKSIFPIPPIDFLGFFPMEVFGFTETYCTMWGEGVHLSGSSGACSSEAAGNVGGVAGLIISRARDLGINLSANEVKQILTMSADDIYRFCLTLTGGGCQRGWDAHFGYGRPNLVRAFEMLGDPISGKPTTIPPEVKLYTPKWFRIIDPVDEPSIDVEAYMYARGRQYDWELQIAPGKEPLNNQFKTIASGNSVSTIDDVIGNIDVSSIFEPDWYENPPENSFDFTVTLRLQASYWVAGLGTILGEDRRTFAVHRDYGEDSGLMPGFPIDLGASGEATPVLYDLDGDPDGRLEIILNSADAELIVLKYNKSSSFFEMMDGFPIDIRSYTGVDTDITLSTPAIGDLFGDGTPYIVVVTGSGGVFVIDRFGNEAKGSTILEGFPVYSDPVDNSSTEAYGHGNSFGAAPVLGDLDNDGMLEIVAACYDGNIYVWKPVDSDSDGEADPLLGFPVFAKSEAGNVPVNKVCHREDEQYAPQILGTPIVGVFDPNSSDQDIAEYPSIFVGTSEVCDDAILKTTRFYGIYHDGYENDSGTAFLPGWPVKITGPLADALPIPPVTIGITSSPAMARFNDRTWFGIGSVAWIPQLLEFNGENLKTHNLLSPVSFNLLGHGSFGRLAGDQKLHYVLPATSAIDMIDGWISLLRAVIVAWDMDDLSKPAMTANVEDSTWYCNAAIADISGDGNAELISGTGGFTVHALDLNGNEPQTWPKFTNNWSISAPALGDIDADGQLEVIIHTREGNLFAWNTAGQACKDDGFASDWWNFHHDEHNSGVYGKDTLPPRITSDISATEKPEGGFSLTFTSPGDDWQCGTPTSYDIRYAQNKSDLEDAYKFINAQKVPQNDIPSPVAGQQTVSFETDISGSDLWFAIQTMDEVGNLSLVSKPVQSSIGSDDDDDDIEDDDDQTSADDDDDNGGEACCG